MPVTTDSMLSLLFYVHDLLKLVLVVLYLYLVLVTGLPGKPSHKMGFRSSVSQSGHPGEGKHEGLVRRNVLTNSFIGFSLA